MAKRDHSSLSTGQLSEVTKNPVVLRPEYRLRLEIILRTEQGQSQSEICAALGCARETVRYWQAMLKSGQIDAWRETPIGRPRTIQSAYLERLQNLVKSSPKSHGYSFNQWTARSLQKHLAQEFDVEVSDRHINRLLKQMGLSTRQNAKSTQAVACSDRPDGSRIQIRDLEAQAFLVDDNLDELGCADFK